jgi:hypothetical protein
MIKHFIYTLIILLFMITSCGTGSKDDANKKKSDTAKVTVLSFLKQADTLIDKPVIIEGNILHTCKHGGKRMFLVDGNDSVTVEVTAGGTITSFDEKLIGSRVRVAGMLREERIDEKYLNEWENEVKKPVENHNAGVHTGTKGHEDQGVQEKLAQINEMRAELKNSGKDHLSNFSIEGLKYEVLK